MAASDWAGPGAGRGAGGKSALSPRSLHQPCRETMGDNPAIDALWTRPYGPPPNWARFLRVPRFWTIFMALTDLVVPQAVVPALRVNSKKQALQELAARAATMCGRNEREVIEVLTQRERLGSTGIGSGIAIP